MQMKRDLWEILVPAANNAGDEFLVEHHHVWDDKVRAISGGLTILKTAKGQWKNMDGKLYQERMIPVRILATREEMDSIVRMTAEYYDQIAVLSYKISDDVILYFREES